MPEPQREFSERFRRKIVLRQQLRWTIGALSCWLVYVLDALFHFDLLAWLHDRAQGPHSTTTYLLIALAATIVCIIGAIVQIQKALHLARFGVEVDGKISQLGLAYQSWIRTECTYAVGNEKHVLIWSDARENRRAIGDSITLLVDPKNPKRCMLRESIFADERADREKDKTTLERVRDWALIAVAVVALPLFIWQRWPKAVLKPPVAAAPAPRPQVQPAVAPPVFKSKFQPPVKEILFQPMFVWENTKPTLQGTGFFVKAPGGRVAAVTSAHFLPTEGPRLLEARWLNLETYKPVAVFKRSWGQPGKESSVYANGMVMMFNGGQVTVRPQTAAEKILHPDTVTTSGIAADRRTDFLLLSAPKGLTAAALLELDPRTKLEPGERVWFHDKSSFKNKDYKIIEGQVVLAAPEEYQIALDSDITLESQSGSPVISQLTGKVIGILAAAPGALSNTIFLTPSYVIAKALEDDHDFPLLADVIPAKKPSPPKGAPPKDTSTSAGGK